MGSIVFKRNERSRNEIAGNENFAKDIYDANSSSLKMQFHNLMEVVHLKLYLIKLILTNHHCGFDVIQNHSTVEHDYLRDGFGL
jgi:hypothetical protein